MSEPPDVVVPQPPNGFVPAPAADLRGFRPMQSDVSAISDAVLELKAIPNWTQMLGMTAVDPTPLLHLAADWTGLMAQTDGWYAYVKSQNGTAWKAALEGVSGLKPAFQAAVVANPELSRQYPALARLLGAQAVVAKRAASTRKKATVAALSSGVSSAAAAPVVVGSAAPVATTLPVASGVAVSAATPGGKPYSCSVRRAASASPRSSSRASLAPVSWPSAPTRSRSRHAYFVAPA